MRSTLDRLWKRGTLPQRAGQSPQPERIFRFQPVICFHRGQRCGGAELGGRHVHDLRHTGSQFAANSGAALKDLMTRMGHDSERATLIISMRRAALIRGSRMRSTSASRPSATTRATMRTLVRPERWFPPTDCTPIARRPPAKAGHIPSWRGSCERYPLSLVAADSGWQLLLLSPLLSAAGPVPLPGVSRRCDRTLSCPGPSPEPDSCRT
jgi:hypothetical protein